jgi:hypothetical protein
MTAGEQHAWAANTVRAGSMTRNCGRCTAAVLVLAPLQTSQWRGVWGVPYPPGMSVGRTVIACTWHVAGSASQQPQEAVVKSSEPTLETPGRAQHPQAAASQPASSTPQAPSLQYCPLTMSQREILHVSAGPAEVADASRALRKQRKRLRAILRLKNKVAHERALVSEEHAKMRYRCPTYRSAPWRRAPSGMKKTMKNEKSKNPYHTRGILQIQI